MNKLRLFNDRWRKLRLFNDWWRNRKYLVFYLSLSLFFLLAVCSMHADVHGHGSCCSPGELGDGRPGWPAVVRGRAAAQGDTGRGRAHSADGRRPQQAAGGGHACPSRVEDREPGRNAHGPRGPRGDRGVGRWACRVAVNGAGCRRGRATELEEEGLPWSFSPGNRPEEEKRRGNSQTVMESRK